MDKCNLCNFVSASVDHVTNHMAQEHPICNTCNARFSSEAMRKPEEVLAKPCEDQVHCMQGDDPKGQHEEAQRGAQHDRTVKKRSQQGRD